MRALIRMRTLAAACALLLMIAGTAAAGPRVRFDRPGQPDVPDPPMVGDPDQPTGNLVAIYAPWILIFRIPVSWMRTTPTSAATSVRPFQTAKPLTRARDAR